MALGDLKFVTSGGWGTGLARPLTAAEGDGNVDTLRAAIQDLIDNPAEGVSVTNIAVSGRQVTFYLSDSTTRGPFLLPIAYPRYRGEWAPSVSYAAMDLVRVTGYGTYLVAVDHTSAGSFDPDASSTAGDYYVQIAPDTYSAAPYENISDATLTLTAAHRGKYLRFLNTSGCTVTVPAGLFPDNAEIHFRQAAVGAITLALDTGVSISIPAGRVAATAATGATFTLKHVTGDQFDIFGSLAEAP